MTVGVLLAGVCFVVALAAEVLGGATGGGSMRDLAATADGLAAMAPWAWASLGTYVLVATPVLGLAVTAVEYALAHDRRSAVLALLVLGVLLFSSGVALSR
jgi:uncharacterized membrane protein